MTITVKFEVLNKDDNAWYGVGKDKFAAPISGLLNCIWHNIDVSANHTRLSSVNEEG